MDGPRYHTGVTRTLLLAAMLVPGVVLAPAMAQVSVNQGALDHLSPTAPATHASPAAKPASHPPAHHPPAREAHPAPKPVTHGSPR
ncbi:hypothetical protein, partial [Acidisphaera sp. L21]|uniref:hypothetical protein n=1 Tax=Acidisphaera sp. L21 TaxID=1641851 RepID=UPI001C206D25